MKFTLIKSTLCILTVLNIQLSIAQEQTIANTFYGYAALPNYSNVVQYNSAFGVQTLFNNTFGKRNTAIGYTALYSNTLGESNTGVGQASLKDNTTGSCNTGVGAGSLQFNTTGENNCAMGNQALFRNTTGNDNTANGYRVLLFNDVGIGNTGLGAYTLNKNTSGNYNAATGAYALMNSKTGWYNTGDGVNSLSSNVTGFSNTAIGFQALYHNNGNNNTALGRNAGIGISSGSNNTIIGGNEVITMGITSGSNNTIIGANVTGLANISNTIILADGQGNQRLYIDNTGKTRIGSPTLTMPGSYKLYVQEGILTERVVVAVANSSNWADYVFAKDYKLMPLSEVAGFVKKNNHLPNVPAAEEVMRSGLDLGAMEAKLLEKIEELTLYLIEQSNEIKVLKKKVLELEQKR